MDMTAATAGDIAISDRLDLLAAESQNEAVTLGWVLAQLNEHALMK